MQAILADPRVRTAARNAGIATIRALGRNRQRRANQGRWYFGRRVGIPPRRRRNADASVSTSALLNAVVTSQPVARSAKVATNPTTQTFNAVGVDWLTDVANTLVENPYVESFAINPAEPSSFPRLAHIASQYQKYVFNSVSLVYTPSCATTQKGTLYIAPIRDPTAALPTTVLQMRGLSGCKSSAVRDGMTITFTKAQLSNALNGFYCEAPDGVTPDLDNVTRTCGRMVLMLDGVAKDDGVVGTLVLRYSFTLSDPKTTPEGAALAGGYRFDGGFTGDLEPTDYDLLRGKPAVTAVEGIGFRKRTVGPIFVSALGRIVGATAPVFTMEIDGVTVPPTHTLVNTSAGYSYRLQTYWIESGRQTFTFNSVAGCTWFANVCVGCTVTPSISIVYTGAVVPTMRPRAETKIGPTVRS